MSTLKVRNFYIDPVYGKDNSLNPLNCTTMTLPQLEPSTLKAAKTIAGAIYYTYQKYGNILDMLSDMFNQYLGLPTNQPYSITLIPWGFKWSCRYFDVNYRHDEWTTDKRIIQIQARE